MRRVFIGLVINRFLLDAVIKLNSIHGQYRAHVRIEEELIPSKESGEGKRRRSSLEERLFDEVHFHWGIKLSN